MEGQVVLTAILQTFDGLRITGPLEWIESFGFRGLKSMPLELRIRS